MKDQPIQLPYTLPRKHLQIRPTRYGIVFILLLLGMFGGSINYNNNLGILLTFLLGSTALVSLTCTFKNISGITIISSAAKPVFAGQQAAFEIMVEDSGTDRTGVGFSFANQKAVVLNFVKGSNIRLKVEAHAAARGILRPGPLLIYSDYPLGLFQVQSHVHLNPECLVYPKPLVGKVTPIFGKDPAYADGRVSGPGTDEFQGLKGYLPGDPLQRISWRASSRGRGLFTKDFKGQYGASFYLDWNSLKSSDREQKMSLLCSAVLNAHRLNLLYGLKLPGQTIRPGNGRIHKNRCLKTLALFSNSELVE
jgi:uncharacterized protein (DUF58 family)